MPCRSLFHLPLVAFTALLLAVAAQPPLPPPSNGSQEAAVRDSILQAASQYTTTGVVPVVQLPAGTLLLTSFIVINSPIALIGSVDGSTSIHCAPFSANSTVEQNVAFLVLTNGVSMAGIAFSRCQTSAIIIDPTRGRYGIAWPRSPVLSPALPPGVNFTDCEFRDNLLPPVGGVVTTIDASVTFSACRFFNNGRNYSVQAFSGNTSRLGNVVAYQSACIAATGGLITVQGSTFANNGFRGLADTTIITRASSVMPFSYGLVSLRYDNRTTNSTTTPTLTISNCTFIGNWATSSITGAIMAANRTAFSPGHGLQMLLTDTNITGSRGPAILGTCTCANLQCRQPTFCKLVMRNTTVASSGSLPWTKNYYSSVFTALSLFAWQVDIAGSLFADNQCEGSGAAMYLESAQGTIASTNFQNNTAALDGGAAYISLPNALTIIRCNFTNNRAGYAGGALYLVTDTTSTTAGNFKLHRSILTGNQAAAFSEDGGSSAGWGFTQGGAIYMDVPSYLDIQRVMFINNSATMGGAVFSNGGRQYCQYLLNVFMGNRAMVGGGAYFSNSVLTYIVNSVFHGNIALSGGGAVVHSPDTFFQLGNNVTFTANVALQNDSSFNPGTESLNSSGLAKAMAAVGGSYTVNFNADLVSHQACGVGGGGGLCLQLAGAQIALRGVVIANNTAISGGGLFIGASGCWFGTTIGCGFVLFGPDVSQAGTAPGWDQTTVVANNTAQGGGGGGLFWTHEDILNITCNPFSNDYTSSLSQPSSQLLAAFPSLVPLATALTPCRSWVGNTAPNGYGDTVASTAFALQVANNLSTTVGQDGTFASGDLLVTQLGVLDAYGQLVVNSILEDRKVTVQADVSRSQGGVAGQKVVTSVRGIAAFEQLKLMGVPGNYSMVFSGAGAARQLHPAAIQVTVRDCKLGEYASAVRTSCTRCRPTSYNFLPGEEACATCPHGATCPNNVTGPGLLVPLDGFWVGHALASTPMLCQNKGACSYATRSEVLGSIQERIFAANRVTQADAHEYLHAICDKGYTGNLCGKCAPGYGIAGVSSCVACPGRTANALAIMATALVTLLFIFVTINTALDPESGAFLEPDDASCGSLQPSGAQDARRPGSGGGSQCTDAFTPVHPRCELLGSQDSITGGSVRPSVADGSIAMRSTSIQSYNSSHPLTAQHEQPSHCVGNRQMGSVEKPLASMAALQRVNGAMGALRTMLVPTTPCPISPGMGFRNPLYGQAHPADSSVASGHPPHDACGMLAVELHAQATPVQLKPPQALWLRSQGERGYDSALQITSTNTVAAAASTLPVTFPSMQRSPAEPRSPHPPGDPHPPELPAPAPPPPTVPLPDEQGPSPIATADTAPVPTLSPAHLLPSEQQGLELRPQRPRRLLSLLESTDATGPLPLPVCQSALHAAREAQPCSISHVPRSAPACSSLGNVQALITSSVPILPLVPHSSPPPALAAKLQLPLDGPPSQPAQQAPSPGGPAPNLAAPKPRRLQLELPASSSTSAAVSPSFSQAQDLAAMLQVKGIQHKGHPATHRHLSHGMSTLNIMSGSLPAASPGCSLSPQTTGFSPTSTTALLTSHAPYKRRATRGSFLNRAGYSPTASQSAILAAFDPSYDAILKIFSTYIQLLALTANINLDWPTAIYGWLAFSQAATSAMGSWISVDCSLANDNVAGTLPRAMQRVILTVFLPIIMWTIVMLVWGMRASWLAARGRIVCWADLRAYLAKRVIISILATVLMLYPKVVNSILVVYQCISLDADASAQSPWAGLPGSEVLLKAANSSTGLFWVPDLSVPCYHGEHRSLMWGPGGAGMLVFALGVPVTCFCLTYWNKERLFTDKEFAANFHFLFREYCKERYFYESVILMQKLAFAATMVFSTVLNNAGFQVLLALCVVEIMLIMQLVFRPYRHHHIDNLSRNMLITLTTTLYLLLFLTYPNISSGVSMAITVLVVVINSMLSVYFLAAVASELYKAAWVVAVRMPGADPRKTLMELLARRLGHKMARLVVRASNAKEMLDRALTGRLLNSPRWPETPRWLGMAALSPRRAAASPSRRGREAVGSNAAPSRRPQ